MTYINFQCYILKMTNDIRNEGAVYLIINSI